jgi:hypothetical protein
VSLRAVVLLLNTAGLAGYFAWLIFGGQRILYTQTGVMYLLPCLPFFFVYFFIFRGGGEPPDHDPGDHT